MVWRQIAAPWSISARTSPGTVPRLLDRFAGAWRQPRSLLVCRAEKCAEGLSVRSQQADKLIRENSSARAFHGRSDCDSHGGPRSRGRDDCHRARSDGQSHSHARQSPGFQRAIRHLGDAAKAEALPRGAAVANERRLPIFSSSAPSNWRVPRATHTSPLSDHNVAHQAEEWATRALFPAIAPKTLALNLDLATYETYNRGRKARRRPHGTPRSDAALPCLRRARTMIHGASAARTAWPQGRRDYWHWRRRRCADWQRYSSWRECAAAISSFI